jgi:hypothetical protein
MQSGWKNWRRPTRSASPTQWTWPSRMHPLPHTLNGKAPNPWLRAGWNNVRRMHQSLHHLVADAPSREESVVDRCLDFVIPAMTRRDPGWHRWQDATRLRSTAAVLQPVSCQRTSSSPTGGRRWHARWCCCQSRDRCLRSSASAPPSSLACTVRPALPDSSAAFRLDCRAGTDELVENRPRLPPPQFESVPAASDRARFSMRYSWVITKSAGPMRGRCESTPCGGTCWRAPTSRPRQAPCRVSLKKVSYPP